MKRSVWILLQTARKAMSIEYSSGATSSLDNFYIIFLYSLFFNFLYNIAFIQMYYKSGRIVLCDFLLHAAPLFLAGLLLACHT